MLNFTDSGLEWVITAYALTFGGFLIFGGRLGDIFGHKKLLMSGLGMLIASSMIAVVSQNALTLILLRGAQGVSAALIAPSALALLITTFTAAPERNRALGAWGSVLGAGFVSGVVAGGLLTQYAGWRWVLLINVPTAGLALIFCPAVLTESRSAANGRRLDFPGAFAITAAILAIVYAVSQGNTAGWLSAQTLGVAAGAVLLLVAFVVIERNSFQPLVPLSVFRVRQVSVANSVNLLLIGSFVGVIYVSKYRGDKPDSRQQPRSCRRLAQCLPTGRVSYRTRGHLSDRRDRRQQRVGIRFQDQCPHFRLSMGSDLRGDHRDRGALLGLIGLPSDRAAVAR